jgi:hypothetical protein
LLAVAKQMEIIAIRLHFRMKEMGIRIKIHKHEIEINLVNEAESHWESQKWEYLIS